MKSILLSILCVLCLSACEQDSYIYRTVEFEGGITPQCIEQSFIDAGLEYRVEQDIYDRPHFRDAYRVEGLSVIWYVDQPNELSIDAHSMGTMSTQALSRNCENIDKVTDAFILACGLNEEAVSNNDMFRAVSCNR